MSGVTNSETVYHDSVALVSEPMKDVKCLDTTSILLCKRDNVVNWKQPIGRSKTISHATNFMKRLSERISITVCGFCIHLCVGCDLVVVYIASCGVIVPLMTFAYVFGAGFFQSRCV